MSDNFEYFNNLFKNLEIDFTIDTDHRAHLKQQTIAAYSRSLNSKFNLSNIRRYIVESKITKYAAAAVILIASIITLAIHDTSPEKSPQPAKTITPADYNNSYRIANDTSKPQNEQEIDEELKYQLDLANQLYQQKNVPALISLLNNSQLATKIIVAKYLGQIGNSDAADALEKVSNELNLKSDDNIFINIANQLRKKLKKTNASEHDSNTATPIFDPNTADPYNNPKYTTLTVILKETGEPVPNAQLIGRFNTTLTNYTSDANGQAKIEILPEPIRDYKLVATADNLVPMEYWRRWKNQQPLAVPPAHTIILEKGYTIGGHILDEDKKPVPDASVTLSIRNSNYQTPQRLRINNFPLTTDPNGYWEYVCAPAEFQHCNIEINHPNFPPTSEYIGDTDIIKREQLFKQSYEIILQKGSPLTGYVIDSAANPVPGASVVVANDYYSNSRLETITDNTGAFFFQNVNPALYNYYNTPANHAPIIVQKTGYAPQLQYVLIEKDKVNNTQITLYPGNTISGTVLDIYGIPVPDASLYLDSWRNTRAIKVEIKTDQYGNFIWQDAPEDEVEIGISKRNYYRTRHKMNPSDQPYTITLYPELKVAGRVFDADTNLPIDNFFIEQGIRWKDGRNSFHRNNPDEYKQCTNGKYEMLFRNEYPGHLLKVQAEGYIPQISPVFQVEDINCVHDFYLEKSEEKIITVYSPDGSPCTKQKVYVFDEINYSIQIRNNLISYPEYYGPEILTDSKGQFPLPPITDDYALVITDINGIYCNIHSDANDFNSITLNSWSLVNGFVKEDSKPMENQQINLGKINRQENKLYISYYTFTDANGYYEFTEVYPGKYHVSKTLKIENRNINLLTQTVNALPNHSHQIDFGELGRRVIGTVKLPEDFNEPVLLSGQTGILRTYNNSRSTEKYKKIYRQLLEKHIPENFDLMTIPQRVEWAKQFQNSQAFKDVQKQIQQYNDQEIYNKSRQESEFVLDEDGGFSIPDITNGTYLISINFAALPSPGSNHHNLVASLQHKFDLTDQQNPQPLDLGILQIEKNYLSPGDTIEDFDCETLKGAKYNLAQFKGKYLLVNLYPENAKDDFIYIKNAASIAAKSPNLEIISITHEYSYEAVMKLLDDPQVNWPLTFIRNYYNLDKNLSLYEIFKYLPYSQNNRKGPNFLLGPDGKVIQPYIKNSQLEQVLSDKLESSI